MSSRLDAPATISCGKNRRQKNNSLRFISVAQESALFSLEAERQVRVRRWISPESNHRNILESGTCDGLVGNSAPGRRPALEAWNPCFS